MKSIKTVIAIAGMPGAGKAVASNTAKEFGIQVFLCGDVLREEAKNRKIVATPENFGKLMLQMRQDEGPSVMIKRLLPRISEAKSKIVMVEGLRSIDELESLMNTFKVILLAIHANPKQRYQRLISRGRGDDPKTIDEFNARDSRELSLGVGSVIALADYMIMNDSTLEKFQQKLMGFFKHLLNKS
ncbi:AAA family ATPase [[Eubacterium] cellulosolvens]